MNMYLLLVLALSSFHSSEALGSCTADNGQKCLTSAEVNGYDNMFLNGDPCFSYSGGKYCVIAQNSNGGISMMSCKCDNAGSGTAPPACDNSGISAFTAQCSNQNTYCGYGSDNSMCKYCGKVSAANCGKVCSLGVISEADKKLIVDTHNKLRRKVAKGQQSPQPSATDMYELKWNDELAQVAQSWTSQCTWKHDTNRLSTSYPKGVGQNMAMSANTANTANRNYAAKIQGWYDEVKDMSPQDVAPYSQAHKTGVVGHYTALAWGNTKEVGCGWVQFYNTAKSYPYQQYLICNYGPGGNIMGLGTKMYTPGATASGCPNGNNDGLCKW